MPRLDSDVKRERGGSPIPSMRSGTMGPPSPNPLKRKVPPSESHHSLARTFNRSHAPSAETIQRRDDETEPIFMEMRYRQDSLRSGQQGSPVSQNADASFLQQSFSHHTFADIGLRQKACNDTLGDLQTLGVSLRPITGHALSLYSKTMISSHILIVNRSYQTLPRQGRSLPWVANNHREIKPFKTIFNPSEIEEVLRWAQIAILNHNRNFEIFIPGEGAFAKETPLDSESATFSCYKYL
ncbi:hypothetical protein Daesc_002482 [Daldinia eschscholtzii]|uniref:Uncharacterized protein n=1 Tax=Daldinia eschscholtzii TaxID=292717 RepID=A0AAX6MXF3_9PEZI